RGPDELRRVRTSPEQPERARPCRTSPSPARRQGTPTVFLSMTPPPPTPPLFPYTTLFRSDLRHVGRGAGRDAGDQLLPRLRLRRSEEHTSELQSPYDLVCRLLLEKKKKMRTRRVQVLRGPGGLQVVIPRRGALLDRRGGLV